LVFEFLNQFFLIINLTHYKYFLFFKRQVETYDKMRKACEEELYVLEKGKFRIKKIRSDKSCNLLQGQFRLIYSLFIELRVFDEKI